MKNIFYQNNSNYPKDISLKNKKQSYIPKPAKTDRKPKFFPGDIVGFKVFYPRREAKIVYYKRNKLGEIEYVVQMEDGFWSPNNTQVFKASDLYLKPLTRKVLFEKIIFFTKSEYVLGEGYIVSGTTY